MQLSEKATISFLYSIVKHQYLGLIIEPFLVEVTAAGNFSLAHQRLIAANSNLYSHLLEENDFNAIKMLKNTSIMNFDDVNNLHQLNERIGKDIHIFKALIK